MSKVVKFITLGCKVNQYETNAMAQKFLEKGYQIIEEETPENEEIKPDICIINTCTVTNMSDRKSRQMLRRMKEKNPNTIVVAVGCYAQVAKEELAKISEIDLVLGNNEKVEIVRHIEEYINNHIDNVELEDVMYSKEFSDFGNVTYTEKTRAVIKIQDGCDRFCSYCIILFQFLTLQMILNLVLSLHLFLFFLVAIYLIRLLNTLRLSYIFLCH